MNAAGWTRTVKKEFKPQAPTESDIGHRRCFVGLQRLRGAPDQVSVAPVECGTNETPA